MYEIKQYAASEFPAAIACQVESFVRLEWWGDAQGEERFWNLEHHRRPDPTFRDR